MGKYYWALVRKGDKAVYDVSHSKSILTRIRNSEYPIYKINDIWQLEIVKVKIIIIN
jgi:hypothetical protein